MSKRREAFDKIVVYSPFNEENEVVEQSIETLDALEELLGVDINLLFAAKEIYFWDWDGYSGEKLIIRKTDRISIDLKSKKVSIYENEWSETPMDLDPENYGKLTLFGWALTKEEIQDGRKK